MGEKELDITQAEQPRPNNKTHSSRSIRAAMISLGAVYF
jgi:hypothetical protein